MLARRLALVMLALAVGAGAARDPSAELRLAVREYLEQNRVTGCSVAIAQDGRIVFAEGFGYANVEVRAPATAETVYRLASVSKPITAVGILRLVEEGKLRLDEDIRTYLPEFPDKGKKITVRQLLNHTSGIRHYQGLESLRNVHYDGPIPALEIFRNDPLVSDPGTEYHYSTYAYTVLAAIMEKVSKKTFPDYMRDAVWRPAGMETAGVEDQRRIVLNRASGYFLGPDGEWQNAVDVDLSYKWGGGGQVGTVLDLCSFGNALLEGRLLSKRTLDEMWTPSKLSNGSTIPYGLGWGVTTYRGERLYSHNGAQQGARSSLWILPERRVVIAVLTNYESHDINKLVNTVADTWLRANSR